MSLYILLISLFFTADSLPSACQCEIPSEFKPRKVNKDTLQYLKNKGYYKQGLQLTFHYLNKDSTDIELIGWLGDFSYQLAGKMNNNKKIRSQKYGENPHHRSGYIQDSTRYIVYEARKKYGPHLWNSTIRRQLAPYALCSTRCATTLYPKKKNFFSKYVETLIASQNFDKVRQMFREKNIQLPHLQNQTMLDQFILSLSEYYIGYGVYKEGVKFVQTVLNNYSISESTIKQLNEIFHYAVRSDDNIPRKLKPIIHEKINQYIPEIEE